MDNYIYPQAPSFTPNNPFNFNYGLSQRMEVVRVTGENGARAYQMPPNSSILLLDETAPLVWLVQTDGAGYKTLSPYTIAPYTPEPPTDVKGLEERFAALEERFNKMEEMLK